MTQMNLVFILWLKHLGCFVRSRGLWGNAPPERETSFEAQPNGETRYPGFAEVSQLRGASDLQSQSRDLHVGSCPSASVGRGIARAVLASLS